MDARLNQSGNCAIRCLFAALAVGVAALLLSAFILAYAADWLRGDGLPQQADAIVVLAGPPERALYAADLFKHGLAKSILVSKPAREHSLRVLDELGIPLPRAEEIYSMVLQRSGVPAANISFFGSGSVSTYDEALALKMQIGRAHV